MIYPGGNVTIINYTISAGNTWESVGALPKLGQAYRLKSRDLSSFYYAYTAVPSAYMTANNGEVTVAIGCIPPAIYVYQGTSGGVIEVEIWE